MQSNPLFYAVTIKPCTGCCAQLWALHFEKNMDQQKTVQRKAMRMTRGSRKHFLKGKTE